MPSIVSSRLTVGLEIHVELATRTKMFTRVGSPAHDHFDLAEPNTLIDPVVLGLPGALPVLNRDAVEMSILLGLALNCSIARLTRWDRKNYFYADMPKNYQISQYDLPLCSGGALDVPVIDDAGVERTKTIRLIRAHLEEDAGKLLHDAPGGRPIDHSIVDFNRAGTPLLEIVTEPDFESAEEVVAFAQTLRSICRFLGVTRGIMQKGHIRFEPNINCRLALSDGREIATPIVEVKNLNSFRSLRGAIDYEARHQPERFLADGLVMGPGAKTTRGWDDARQETFVQREKEDAHDYRYFPDPDLPPLVVSDEWRESIRERLPELPHSLARRFRDSLALNAKEAAALVEEPETCRLFTRTVEMIARFAPDRAGRLAANFILQTGFKLANERGVMVHELGIAPGQIAGIARLREDNQINSGAAAELFAALCGSAEEAPVEAARLGLLQVRDDSALEAWCDRAIEASPRAAEDVRAGRMQAMGRLIGEAMKLSGGKADAALLRRILTEKLAPRA